MGRRRHIGAIVAFSILTLLGAGCGSDRASSGTTAAPPSIPATTTTTAPATSATPPDGLTVAAESICPTLWQWQKDVSAVFNDMSHAAASEPAADARRRIYFDALDAVVDLADAVVVAVEPWRDDPVLRPLVVDVDTGVRRALERIDELRGSIVDDPSLDADGHRIRLSAMIVAFEKIIDLPKPELATYGDTAIMVAFDPAAIPSCQFGVKDANDGVPRSNG